MAENKEKGAIDLKEILQKIRKHKKSFIKPLAIVFVLSVVYIYSQPRYYMTEMKLAPEIENPMSGGSLSSLASSFGLDIGNMQTTDAITPLLYPDLMDDNGFVSMLFPIHIKTKDGAISTSYYDYLKNYQKSAWWSGFTNWFFGLFKSEDEGGGGGSGSGKIDPYRLSKKDNDLISLIQTKVKLNVDKRTGVIAITVKDQDPMVCKTIADSTTVLLQSFITDYRTNKARIDVNYYTALCDSAYREYENALKAYGRYADANMNVILQSHRSKMNDLENNAQLRYTTYTTLSTQLQAAKTKVQEKTPAFTVLKGAALPVKPAGPGRMKFIFLMLFLTFFAVSAYILIKK